MSGHTPGPWKIEREHDGWSVVNRQIPAPDDSWCIAEVYDNECGSANVSLISASPDMLAALIDCRRVLELANFTGELAVVDAAIAKAKGESQ